MKKKSESEIPTKSYWHWFYGLSKTRPEKGQQPVRLEIRFEVPVEALELNEVVSSLTHVRKVLRLVRPEHVGTSAEALRRVITEIDGWRRQAEWQLRSRYLAP